MASEPTDLIKGINVASLPAIYTRLIAVMNHPRSSARDIGKVVSDDPGLTARLLRIVNSAFFSFPQRIQTVSHAVTIIGTEQLRDLALATSVLQMFKDIPPELVDMDSFWRHSMACGVAARVMAAKRRESNIERFFMAGMLHDIGSLIIFLKNGAKAREVLDRCAETGELRYKVEQDLLGFTHATVGRALLKAWKLPEAQQEAIGFHHAPGQAPRFPVEAAMVHVADIIANSLQVGSSGERLVPPLSHDAWAVLRLPDDCMPAVMGEVERQLPVAVSGILQESRA